MTSTERIFLAQLQTLWPVLDPLPASVIAVSWRNRILFANRAARKLLGPEPERRSVEDALAAGGVVKESGGRIDAHELGVVRALGGTPVEGEELRLRMRGAPVVLRINAAPIQGPDRRALGVIVLLTDVTPLARSEERARLLAELGQALSSGADGISARVADLTSRGLGAPCALFLARKGTSELIPEGHGVLSPPLRAAAEKAFETAQPVLSREVLAVPIPAEPRPLGAIAVGGNFGDGDASFLEQIASRTGLALENARLLYETRAASEAKDAILAVASHEIMTPLSALAGYAELLLRLLDDPEPSHAALERTARGIRRTIERVSDLSRRLLDSERIRTGQLLVERRSEDLLPTLRETAERAAIAADRSILFEARVPHLPGQWDLLRMEEVLQNLLSNAMRYSPNETPVRVRVETKDKEAIISVEDCGIGIPAVDHPSIFTAFRRGSNAKFGGPGLGLGLHLVDQIVRAHDGRISFDTELEKGTTFRVVLPLG